MEGNVVLEIASLVLNTMQTIALAYIAARYSRHRGE